MKNYSISGPSICMSCKEVIMGTKTYVRKAIKPKRAPHRWITVGFVHEGCENKVILEQDPWK
jgi:hypothetical protein